MRKEEPKVEELKKKYYRREANGTKGTRNKES